MVKNLALAENASILAEGAAIVNCTVVSGDD